MRNGVSAAEYIPSPEFVALRDQPEKFSFIPERDAEIRTINGGNLLFMMGVITVPVEASLDFYIDHQSDIVDHKQNGLSLSTRFTVCHPPQPLSRSIAQSAQEALKRTHQTLVAPLHDDPELVTSAAVDHIRQADLLVPQRLHNKKHDRLKSGPQPLFVGGLALYENNDTIQGAIFMSGQRLQIARQLLQVTQEVAMPLLANAIALELPSTQKLIELVTPRLESAESSNRQITSVETVAA